MKVFQKETSKTNERRGRIYRSFVILVTLFIFTTMMSSCSSKSSYSGTMIVDSSNSDRWKITAKSINGNYEKEIELTSDNIDAIKVTNKNSEGTISIIVNQGDISKTFDISNEYDGTLDLSNFKLGKINLRVELASVKDLDLFVGWK